MYDSTAKYPGVPTVINGNGAVAHVMRHVCGGVIGYPITPSTEISELYEAARAEGAVNVWGRHPFFFSPEGEHSAQSGALGAALTGGQFISNASSSQGILYALESHYVTVGKKIGGFVLQVAARVVSKHSLNVMAGHDDVYALLPSGYTILFGANPQEAADLAAIAYRTAALTLIPVANAMDGFATSHMLSEARLPEPGLLAEYLGDPAGRIPSPTVAQEMLFGAKGRVHQLGSWLTRRAGDFPAEALAALRDHLRENAEAIERDNAGDLVPATVAWVPDELQAVWRRQWTNAFEKGTRQLVPALVDVHNPGLTGPVQNQPDFQAGAVDHRTHFASAVPRLVREAMAEYGTLTGRQYAPVHAIDCDDADVVFVGLGSVTEDVQAVLPHLRSQGLRVGLAAVKLLQPFPEAELVAAVGGARAVIVLERSDTTSLTGLVTGALYKAMDNARESRHPGVPTLSILPRLTTAIFGLGGHDLQPRHLIAAARHAASGEAHPLIYLGSQFFSERPGPELAALQEKLRAAYPETELMALATEPNPRLLPDAALRIRFHSVGGYGTIATGKLLTDILAGALELHSKSAPKYGSEKSGAPTNYYITLSPDPVLITNAELEEVEVVLSPDHKVFHHTDPLKGLVAGGTFILQSNLSPEQVWRELPPSARRTIRERQIEFFIVDAFTVARRHAPTVQLQTRMMGIAFIGAVVGHVQRVAAGAGRDVILDKVRQQISKKFRSKGAAIIEGNMAVIVEGLEATHRVDYLEPEFASIEAERRPIPLRTVSLSASMCQSNDACSGLFDPDYYEQLMAGPFRDGTIAEAPVLPGSGLFMPAGTAAAKDKGLFRRTVPVFQAELCTGCMECALVCPDAAIPNSVHEIHELLLTAIGDLEVTAAQADTMKAQVFGLGDRIRSLFHERKDAPALADLVSLAAAPLVAEAPTLARGYAQLSKALAAYPVARTRPFFDAMERQVPGSGGLFSATIDPWKCTGCLECVEVCGPKALVAQEQDQLLMDLLGERFAFMSRTPNTAARFHASATDSGGEVKRLLLDRGNYYATTGGHGGCRGCGEVTAIRLVMATNHAIGQKRRKEHLRELETLLSGLEAKREAVSDVARQARLTGLIGTLERRLYLYEGGPTGNGPASAVVANSTGCSSVYASTVPFNAYTDPWVNSLFQDAQPLAKGIFEGLCAQSLEDVKALRAARQELADAWDGSAAAALDTLSWAAFTPEELGLLPTVLTIGGDGATYDIGFGALSRVLASQTPLKVLVLNTGAYSNTGGQASTSSFTGQDSDLARIGSAHTGKKETRKEMGLLASFHPHVFVCSTTPALQSHFLRNTMEFLSYTDAPAVMDVYTPCQSEHGIPDAASAASARRAVESRMNPVFVHDPRRGSTLHEWFTLDGNPDVDATWTTTTVEYLDESGGPALLEVPFTPADFALGEARFAKQFRPLSAGEAPRALLVSEYIELSPSERAEWVPFVYATDGARRLRRMTMSDSMVELVEERRRYWQMLQYLAGQHVDRLNARHRADVEQLSARYAESVHQRDASLDDIARAMADLAASSTAPLGGGLPLAMGSTTGPGATATPSSAPARVAVVEAPVQLDPDDQARCTDCKTCYQEIPELFERTRVIIDGSARDVARMIPGALERVTMTPDLLARIARVKATCDAEIIR